VHTPTIRNVAILTALVTAALGAGCGSKNDTTGGQKPDAPKADAAKPGTPPQAATAAPAAAKPQGLPVKAVAVVIGKVADDVTAVGSLLARQSVIIRPEIDGSIAVLHFEEGQAVSAGTRLVTIDSAEVDAQVAGVKADLKTEEQRLARSQELFEQKFISKDALDVQNGNTARLRAKLREAESRAAKTVIRAPFSGIVGLSQVSRGAYLKAGSDIVRLADLSIIKVDFRIPEVYLAKVRPNQEIALRLDAYPGEEFRGHVFAVEPAIDEKTRTIVMRARIPNKNNKLKPGMFARVVVTLENRSSAILVPEQAIWPQGQDSYVFRVVEGKALLTKITIGNRQPGQVEIIHGLSPTDIVITEGQMKLRDGAPVTVMSPPPEAPSGAPAAGAPAKS
jgi:membrane fusion protein (multidrug efflux system)